MEALVTFLTSLSGPVPYIVVFSILLACGLGLPIPEDVTLFAAGLLSYYGGADVSWMIVISLVGVMIGDSFMFFLGDKYGRRLAKKGVFARILHPERFQLIQKKLKRQGNKVIFAARFMPGLRAPIFFVCGMMHVRFRVFAFYDGMAALISVPAIVYSVYYFGDEVDAVIGVIRRAQHGILFVILAVILIVVGKWYLGRKRQKRLEELQKIKR